MFPKSGFTETELPTLEAIFRDETKEDLTWSSLRNYWPNLSYLLEARLLMLIWPKWSTVKDSSK